MIWTALVLALLPAALHWWWTRYLFEASASAVLPERHLATAQRVSFVSMLCTVAIIVSTQWQAAWILPVQFVALTATTYRMRRAMFGETWPFSRYLSWRLRFHAGMFGLWWFVAAAPAAVAQASASSAWWLSAFTLAIALAWHHWSGRVLLVLIRASRLERPDLDGHFQRVFTAARVPPPALWRAGEPGGRLANAFALVTLGQRGVLFFDSLLEQLPADEITAILAHEVAHLEQFHRRRLLAMYAVTTVLIVLLMIGSAVAAAFVPEFESLVWIVSVVGVLGAMWLRARRMQAHETDADLRAIDLCGDADAVIRGLTHVYEINHIPRRWSAAAEQHATHPSLARRIRTIRERIAAPHADAEPIARMVVASPEQGRRVVIDHNRVGFIWIDGDSGDPATIIDRANRVEMITYDQLSELRVSARRGAIALTAVDRHGRRWSMPVHEADVARIQAALDRVDHLVVGAPTRRGLGIVRRAAVLLVVLLAAPYNAIGAVLMPALLAVRRPTRQLMLTLAAALAATAIASANELDVPLVRIALLGILTIVVLSSVRRRQEEDAQPDGPLWTWVERAGLLAPILVGLVVTAANAQDLFGLHAAIRDRGWFPASLAAMAVFSFVRRGPRAVWRAGLGIAVLATAALVVGSRWFMRHAVADPLVAAMPSFTENAVPAVASSQQVVDGEFSSVDVTPNGTQFLLSDYYDEAEAEADDESASGPRPQRFIIAGFDGWSREIRALDVAVIDDQRLLVLDRPESTSRLRAEELRSGRTLWTIALPGLDVLTVHAAPDGRWRAFARRGYRVDRLDGRVGTSSIEATQWTMKTDNHGYVDMPLSDGGTTALAVSQLWELATRLPLTDSRPTTRLLRLDSRRTTELAMSHLRVDCPPPPIGVTGYVCISYEGRSSRIWRVDLGKDSLAPVAETRQMILSAAQVSQNRVIGTASGRPMIADLDSHTLVTLMPQPYCWAMDVNVTKDVAVSICSDGHTTTATQYRLPAVP